MSYSAVIVDDEPIILESLKKIITSNFSDIKVVGQSNNSTDAFNLITSLHPHIAIIDIQMPPSNGIELIKRLKDTSLETHYVLLTAHREFEYAKRAIALNVEDYLLKPLQTDALIECLNKIKNKINSKNSQSNLINNYQKLLPEVIKHNFIDLINGIDGFIIFQSSIKDFLWNMKEPFIAYMFSIDEKYRNEIPKLESVFYTIFNTNDSFICEYNNHIYLLISDNFNNRSKTITFREMIINDYYINIILYESNRFSRLSKLPDIYKHLLAIESKNFYYGYQDKIINERFRNELSKSIHFDNHISTSSIIDLIRFHKYEDAKNKLFVLLSDIKYEKNVLPEVLKKSLNDLVIEIINNFTLTPSLKLKLKRLLNDEMLCAQTFDLMAQKMNSILDLILQELQNSRVIGDNTINIVYNYCSQYYYKDISLDYIAAKVNMSKNYFCTYFKKKTGNSFNTYLTTLRIDIAKEYLLYSNKKISDIAIEIGYLSASHFGNVFKKNTGMTPMEYRANQ
ncbi:MAG: hypothetical protein CVU98_01915 [Firmicutes bacterium HGW-Firmicutes-3]|jgi:two-component system response regulator YesN|nr:MAG: hypothetical protein CVU98_01915 [Firmicutes bacterium HGW-Firmicutes-3]